MENKVNLTLVGAFVLLLGAALIAAVLRLSSGKDYGKSYETYALYMNESVSGLDLDAPVRYRGVQVGAVRRIALAPENPEQVQLLLDIERGTPIKEDTVAVLRTQGLTGIAHVELSGGSRGSPALLAGSAEKYPVIRTGPSLLVRLDAAVTSLLANLTRSSENLNALLAEDNRVALGKTLAHLELVSRTIATRANAIDAGVLNAARALDNSARSTAEVPALLARLHASADAFDRTLGELAGAGVSARNLMDTVRVQAERITGDTLLESQSAIGELRQLAATLQRIGDELERDPALLLRGRGTRRRGPGEGGPRD